MKPVADPVQLLVEFLSILQQVWQRVGGTGAPLLQLVGAMSGGRDHLTSEQMGQQIALFLPAPMSSIQSGAVCFVFSPPLLLACYCGDLS